MANDYYRRGSKSTPTEDLVWLRSARDKLRGVCGEVLAPGQTLPLRTAQVDYVLKALGRLQHVLYNAIEEASVEATGEKTKQDEDHWLGYPPPRR